MSNFWADHWWLLIPLGAFTIPLAGIAVGAFAIWQHHHSRNQALAALKIYAQQGKEPPEALLKAIGDGDEGSSKWDWQRRWTDEAAASGAASAGSRYAGRWSDPEAIRARTEYYTARAAARAARWRAREPIRRWNNAFFLVVGAGALYYASQHYVADHVLSDRLYVGAIIVGALAAAAVLAAILATLFRPQ